MNFGGMLRDEDGGCAMLAGGGGLEVYGGSGVLVNVAFAAALPHRRVIFARVKGHNL
jgi:hypothetical protein